MQDYQMMLKTYQKAGGTPDIFKDPRIAHLVVNQNNVLGSQSTDGLTLTAKEKERGIDVDLGVEEGIRIAHPVHLCFGVLPKEGRQLRLLLGGCSNKGPAACNLAE